MLPKKFRLQDYQEIERVKKKGKLYQTPLFGFLVLKKENQPFSRFFFTRFTFIISKKISKKATERNKTKRLLSEATRELLLKIKPGFDAVFLAKKSLIGRNYIEVKKETESLFKKCGLLS